MGLVIRTAEIPDWIVDDAGDELRFADVALARSRIGVFEDWHPVVRGGLFPLRPPWVTGPGGPQPGFLKDPRGIVHIRGQLGGPATYTHWHLFTLPLGYRPETQEEFPTVVTYKDRFDDTLQIEIWMDGTVRVAGVRHEVETLELNDIAFFAVPGSGWAPVG